MPLIEALQVMMTFRQSHALRGVDVGIDEGEIVAITGSSGSGKSSLLFCLASIVQPTGGEIRFAGGRIDDLPEKQRCAVRRASFGFVFQFSELVPELPLIENVSLPLRLIGHKKRRALAAAEDMLATMGIADLASRRPSEVSGGQAQRAAIARALVHNPKVVFADEPTGSLDTENGHAAMAALTRSARDRGSAVVLVTHDLTVAAYADRQIVLTDGRIAEPGSAG
jgi:putative ABC transport system ATP-binding protein